MKGESHATRTKQRSLHCVAAKAENTRRATVYIRGAALVTTQCRTVAIGRRVPLILVAHAHCREPVLLTPTGSGENDMWTSASPFIDGDSIQDAPIILQFQLAFPRRATNRAPTAEACSECTVPAGTVTYCILRKKSRNPQKLPYKKRLLPKIQQETCKI